MSDIFDLTFEILQASLVSGRVINSKLSSSSPSNNDKYNLLDGNIVKEESLNERLDVAISLELKKSSNDRINKIKLLRKSLLNNAKNNILQHEPCEIAVKSAYEKSKEFCQRQHNISKRRLEQQVEISERRMRELVFEIIGEYGKSNIRIIRRQQIIKFISRIKILYSIWLVRWERFCLRLCYECSHDFENNSSNVGIKYQLLCPESNIEECKSVESKLRKKLGPAYPTNGRIECVVKFNKKSKTQINSGKPTIDNILIANNESEIRNFCDILRNWATTSTRPNSNHSSRGDGSNLGSARINSTNIQLRDFLQSSLIAWLHPGSFYPIHWDRITLNYKKNLIQYDDTSVLDAIKGFSGSNQLENNLNLKISDLDQFVMSYTSQFACILASERIFFSLEERLLSMENKYNNNNSDNIKSENNDSDALMEALSALQTLYARKNIQTTSNVETFRRTLNSEPLGDIEALGHHRTKRYSSLDVNTQDLLRSYPDVIKAKTANDVEVHFAPASILHLAEVKEFQKVINTDEIRTAAVMCPHPNLTQICSAVNTQGNLLDRLYCLVRLTPPKLSPLNPSSQDTEKKVSEKDENSEVLESFQYMIPLSDLCMRELIRVHLFPKLNTKCNATDPSFFNLLPDHARVRNSSTNSGLLTHKYVLLQDSGSNNTVEGSSNQRVQTTQSCYYLIQISDDLDPIKGVTKNFERHDLHDSILKQVVLTARNELKLGLKSKPKQQECDNNLSMHDQSYNTYNEEDNSRPTKWDPTVLSTLCRWRACLCEATNASTKYLCNYHSQLKKFLDEKAVVLAKGSKNVVSESTKYLPKKAPNLASIVSEVKKDLVLIRAASTLLQELWDGKLHATVKSFLKKTIADLGIRRRLEMAVSSITVKGNDNKKSNKKGLNTTTLVLPNKPEWMIWRDDEYKENAFDVINENEAIINNIHTVETMINEELKAMLDFKIYPTSEIAIIRKDIKAFKDFQDEEQASLVQSKTENNIISTYKVLALTLRNELKVCDRKLSIFRARRVDEVLNRENIARRIARAKVVEDEQKHDPANFGFRR